VKDRTSYEFVRVAPGGLLLDLASGSLFRLNESAALIWEAWLGGAPTTAVAHTLERSYGVPLSTADDHVRAALTIDPSEGLPAPPSGDFLYERAPDGYVFSRGGTPFLIVDDRGETIRLHAQSRFSPPEVGTALASVAPKLLALRGHFVLHASAALVDGVAFVVAGESGAGKTTTARALVRAGARPLAEDKLVIRATPGSPETFSACENDIERWAQRSHVDLSRGITIRCPDVEEICTGAAVPIREIGFIDASRRAGESIAAARLTTLDAAGALFGNSFCGSDLAADWRRNLHAAIAIAAGAAAFDLTMPAGTDALDAAAGAVLAQRSFRSR
jgi:hypothetical protein